MMTFLETVVGVVLLALPEVGHAVSMTNAGLQTTHSWVGERFLAPGAKPPFSFVYDGRRSDEILPSWDRGDATAKLDAQRVQWTSSYTDPKNSLVVQCEAIEYADYPAVEWVLHFENRGHDDSAILTDVWAADFALTSPAEGEMVLHYADGSQGLATDFQPHEAVLGQGSPMAFSPQGGRSSDGMLPYFNVTWPGGGVMLAIGWTGQWAASIGRDAGNALTVRAGMERTHLRLHPGERVRTPAILLLFYSGDRMRGHNLWRQFMRAHYTPIPDGRMVDLPVAASGAAIGFNNVTAANQIQAAQNVVKMRLPVDTWWIDAGWSKGGFPLGMGTWDPDPERFPNGLRPVADVVHQLGLRFLVWFEPERVMPDTRLRVEHPDWLLTPADLPAPLAYQKDWRLLNLGNPEALAWAKRTFSGMVRDAAIDICRHDCNIHPLYYWRNGEAPDREGMNEIRYIEGLYDYFETLARERPGLLLDNCASGGRRLDFEMMRRSVPLWRTDYCWDPLGAQCIAYGLSFWLPLHGLGAVSTDPYDFRSGMGANISLAFDYYSLEAGFWPALAERILEYQQVRKYYWGDYYPLTPYATGQDAWLGWQLDRPDLGEGMVQAFRRAECPEESARLALHALDAEARYEVTDLDAGKLGAFTGNELMKPGLVVTIPKKPGAAVITYKKTDGRS